MKKYKEGKILSPKQAALERVYRGFDSAFSLGYTTTFGIKINCTRNDKQNLDSLYQYMTLMNIPSINFRLFDNTFIMLTKDQVGKVVLELVGYGLWIYQHKWELEALIEVSSTSTEYNAINW